MTTIVRAYQGELSINWVRMIKALILRLKKGIYVNQGCPLTPYLMHVYHHIGVLTDSEQELYADSLGDWDFNLVDEPTAANGT